MLLIINHLLLTCLSQSFNPIRLLNIELHSIVHYYILGQYLRRQVVLKIWV
jgi:hypothetical protein